MGKFYFSETKKVQPRNEAHWLKQRWRFNAFKSIRSRPTIIIITIIMNKHNVYEVRCWVYEVPS
jgi:hypothetical protein